MRVGLTVLNSLKGGGTEKRGGETKILKRGQTGSRDGCLKNGGAGTPLQTKGGVQWRMTEWWGIE